MIDLLALLIALIFAVLALWHLYWAAGGKRAKAAAIPRLEGRPAFRPSRAGTLAVAAALLLSGALVLLVSGRLGRLLPHAPMLWLSYGLALVLLLRAIGDFRLVGFFKRVRGSRFARLDTMLYSPLCLALSAGVFLVAYHSRP
jgi:hypothetical protein